MELTDEEIKSLTHISSVLGNKLFEANPGLEDYDKNGSMVVIFVEGLDSKDNFKYEVHAVNLDHDLVTHSLKKDPNINCLVIFEAFDGNPIFGVRVILSQ